MIKIEFLGERNAKLLPIIAELRSQCEAELQAHAMANPWIGPVFPPEQAYQIQKFRREQFEIISFYTPLIARVQALLIPSRYAFVREPNNE